MGHVFISYSHKDSAYVDRLTAYFAGAGIEVWTDRGIEYGAEWVRTIDQQIRACAAFVPVMSHNSRQAAWVAKEILLALQLDKPILPLLLDGERFLELLDIQDEDVTGGRLPSPTYLARLKALTETAPAKPASGVPPAGRVVAWGSNQYGQADVPAGLTGVIAVAAGSAHSLALHADGHVTAWGRNDSGQTNVPPGLTDVVAIAAGGNHSLALHADGRVTTWGSHHYGQTSVPEGLTDVVAVAAGGHHSLALDADGHVTAWGDNAFGQACVPTGLANVVAIAAGWWHSLALHADGHVTAWGRNDYGQTSVPAGLTDVVAIAGGDEHSLAIIQL